MFKKLLGVKEEVMIPKKKPMVPGTGEGGIDVATGGADAVGILDSGVSQVTKDSVFRADPSLVDLVKQGDYGEALVEGAKKFGKAVFTNKDGTLDKTALLAAGSLV